MSAPIYPALHVAADAASRSAQALFLRLTKATLVLLLAIAVASAWPTPDAFTQRRVASAAAVLMLVVLIISVLHRVRRLDDHWFKCRAIAENVKSAAWVFAMRPAPRSDGERVTVEDLFFGEIQKIRERFSDQASRLAGHAAAGGEITTWMRTTQTLPLADRVNVLREFRIQHQIDWYSGKAKHNADREAVWSTGVIVVEIAAVVLAVVQAVTLWRFNVTGVAATAASVALTWVQTKRFSDLSNSYAVAAQDLRLLLAKSERCRDEQAFANLVLDVEMAVSREHSMWLGRRVG